MLFFGPQRLAFNNLKQALTSVPILYMPDFSQPFIVECDASSDGVGAILLQSEHLIAYFSKGFSFFNRFKSAYDRELLALVLAVQKWKHYLMGCHFTVCTDHHSLQHLLQQRVATKEQQRLLIKLLPFDFTIVHKPGKQNFGADALSRRPQHADFLALSLPHSMNFANWSDALDCDPFTKGIIQDLQLQPTSHPDFHLVDQKLYFKERLVVPDDTALRQKLLFESHDTSMAGHGGYLKTLKCLSAHFFWPRMKSDVKQYVLNCLICQQAKYQTLAPVG